MNQYTINPDEEYAKAMDRTQTVDNIISLEPTYSREYLATLSIDELHEIEDSLLGNHA